MTTDPNDKTYRDPPQYVCTFAYNFTGTSLEKPSKSFKTEVDRGHGWVDFGGFNRQDKSEPESDTPKAHGGKRKADGDDGAAQKPQTKRGKEMPAAGDP